jgi:hypothetical protein
MVNKIISRRGKRIKYSKRKKFSKYRKHHTRKFVKRFQRRIKRRRQTRNKKGGDFDLTIVPGDSRLGNMPENTRPIYTGFADVKKISGFNYIFSRESPRQVIIYKYKNKKGKTMLLFVKCKSDEKCGNIYDDSSSYKVYEVDKLHKEETGGNTKFVFEVDQGEGTYQIKLTEGANGYTIQAGINNLKEAIQEQENENQQQRVV